MAFSFGNPSLGAPAVGAGGNVQNGPDLEDITTEVRLTDPVRYAGISDHH